MIHRQRHTIGDRLGLLISAAKVLVLGFGLAAVASGCGGSDGSSPVGVGSNYAINVAVLGGDIPNVLKGMMVTTRSDADIAYVAGIMTPNLAVVDLSSGQLVDSFTISSSNTRLSVVHMIFDTEGQRLWIVSGRGEFLKIVDPAERTVIAEADLTSDMASGASDFPVSDAALDTRRHRMYLARSDGGTRVTMYDESLTKQGEILLGKHAMALRWDESRDALVALLAPPTGAAKIVRLPAGSESEMVEFLLPSSPGGRPPRFFALDTDGDFFVVGSKLWRLDGDSGAVMWEVPLSYEVAAVEVSGDEVAILQKYGDSGDSDDFRSRLNTYQASKGSLIDSRYAGYEASRMAPRPGGGFVVGNAGDASVGIFAVGTADPVEVKVGSAAEDVAYTPDGRVLVLNRLGGSQLIELNPQTGETRVLEDDVVGAWPIRMALYPEGDRLFCLSHFESKLSVLRLSDLSLVGEISLWPSHSLTDTLSDLGVSADGSLLACLLSEQGVVVVVDAEAETVVATARLGPVREGIGPGRMQAAVDSVRGRVFCYLADNERLYRLDASRGYQATTTLSVVVSPTLEAKQAYQFGAVTYIPTIDKVFVYDQVVNPDTLRVENSVQSVHRVLAENGGILYADRHESDGRHVLITLDAATFTESDRVTLANYWEMGATLWFDFSSERFVDALAAQSELCFFDLPVR